MVRTLDPATAKRLVIAGDWIDAAAGAGIDRTLEHRWTTAPNPDLDIGLDASLTGRAARFTL
ncbi:hypothetical protein [Rhodococcus sp. NPDC059234]|uniref:hypothetical protein n=1 Tax=Rhodococcus sp. NPDC059234 TaxID=3346781 RepID=UPI00366BEA24